MTTALLVGALVGFLSGFLAALRWMDASDTFQDKIRLDWLQREHERVDPVATLSIKSYYRRDRRVWTNVSGSIRDAIDRGRKIP